MLKITVGLASSALAFCLTQTVFADQKPASTPPRILVTCQVLVVPGDTAIPASDTQPASGVYNTLLQIPGAEASEISVQTTAGCPAEARYNRVLAFSTQDHGKSTRVFLDVPTSLEATPHINPNDTITVQLKTDVTYVTPAVDDEVPRTSGQSWQTTLTFNSGEMRMFGTANENEFTSMSLLAGNTPKILARNKALIASQSKKFVRFVTVTVLPNETAAAR